MLSTVPGDLNFSWSVPDYRDPTSRAPRWVQSA